MQAYLIFVADAADIVRGEFCVMCGNFRCREILDVEKFYLWRSFGRGEILDDFTLFCSGMFLDGICDVLLQNLCCRILFTLFVEKN